MSLSGFRSSRRQLVAAGTCSAAVRNFIFSSHSSPVMAWKNQPSDFFAARISTTLRSFQSVGLNRSDAARSGRPPRPGCGRPSGTDCRVRPTRSRCASGGRRSPRASGRRGPPRSMSQVALAARPSRRRSRTASARRAARRPAPGRQHLAGVGRATRRERARLRPVLRRSADSLGRCSFSLALAAATACVDHVLRRAGGHDVAAFVARLGAQVDHPVGRLDHVEVVLDHHDRVAQVDQPVEHVQQLGQVVEVQAGGRLVQQVERLAGVGPREFGGQLHPLGLAAGERRGRLAEREVVEPHVAERLQRCGGSWGCSRTARTASPQDMSSTSAIDWPW